MLKYCHSVIKQRQQGGFCLALVQAGGEEAWGRADGIKAVGLGAF